MELPELRAEASAPDFCEKSMGAGYVTKFLIKCQQPRSMPSVAEHRLWENQHGASLIIASSTLTHSVTSPRARFRCSISSMLVCRMSLASFTFAVRLKFFRKRNFSQFSACFISSLAWSFYCRWRLERCWHSGTGSEVLWSLGTERSPPNLRQ